MEYKKRTHEEWKKFQKIKSDSVSKSKQMWKNLPIKLQQHLIKINKK